MISSLQTSCSVTGSLSREVDSIRMRCKSLYESIVSCTDKSLCFRLKKELSDLEKRKLEILDIASSLKKSCKSNNIGIDFLIEICNRPTLNASSVV